MLAMITRSPVFSISPEEATMMAGAIVEVSKHYEIAPSGKTMALVNLAAVCGMIYLPRVLQSKAAKAEARRAAQAARPATVEDVIHQAANGHYDLSGANITN